MSQPRLIFVLSSFLLTCSIHCSFSQKSPIEISEDLSYEDIKTIWLDDNQKYLNEFFDIHKAKAIKEGNIVEWAHAYRYKASSLRYSNKDCFKTLDTAVTIAKKLKKVNRTEYDRFLIYAHWSRGAISFYLNMDEKATDSFIKCFRLAKKMNELDMMIASLNILAYLKAAYGQESEGIELQQNTLKFIKKNRLKIPDYKFLRFEGIWNLAYCYAFIRNVDSARFYIDQSIPLINQGNDMSFIHEDLVVLEAQIDYYQGNIVQAKDTLLKYAKIDTGTTKADRLYYLGMIEGKFGNPNDKAHYFQSIDSIMNALDYPLVDNINEVYQFLLKGAIADRDENKEKEYLNRLIYYDSLLVKTQNRLEEITLKEFDLPMQEEEVSLLSSMVSTKDKWLQMFYVLCAVLLFGMSGYYLKYRNTKKRLEFVMANPISVEVPYLPRQSPGCKKGVDEEVQLEILEKLAQWEAEEAFLDHVVNQHSLAKDLGTNSAYLSHTINCHKGQNFASYLKDLRITHAINHLKENPDMANSHSMVQIAEMFGFNSISVFNKALKAKIGVTPGAFLKKLSKSA